MQKLFIPVGESLPEAERKFTEGLQITLEYYEDGVEATIIDNYEGRVAFDIVPTRERDVNAFVAQLINNGYVYAGHQVLRIRAMEMRQKSPRNRYEEQMKQRREETKTTKKGKASGSQSKQGDGVRKGSAELSGDEAGS